MAPTPERDNVPPDLHQTTWCTEKALEFIGQAQAPWMLCVNVFYPHKPFNPPWEYYRRFDPAAMPFPHFRESDIAHQDGLAEAGVRFQTRSLPPDERNARALYAAYCAMVALVDDQFGRILSFLDETAQRENTVVLFTSDHGEMLGDHGLVLKGCRFYEGGVHVPLIWSWPEHFRCGMRSSALVELIDIAPTLLDLAGLPIPERTQGKSLLPILTGRAEPDKHREFVRSEYFDHRPSSPVHATMYRDDRWKIVAYHSADHDDLGELYDLENDPWEFIDLWQNPEYRDLKLQLLKKNFDARVLAMDPGPPQTMSF
jgi:arylsulfatase A-like enzyme